MSAHKYHLPQPLFDTLENFSALQTLTLKNIPVEKASDDYRYACAFLYSYRGSDATFLSYRREIERLLHWCWFVIKKSIAEVKRTDIEAFIEFCQKPPLNWIGVKNVSRFINNHEGKRIPNPEWRPFVVNISKTAFKNGEQADPKKYSLSQKALQAIFSILSSFYNYLIQENYVEFNPVSQIRQKSRYIRKHQTKAIIRRLTELQWSYVIETAEQMAQQNPDLHERTLFIMTALYGMYLRISELTSTVRWQPTMGDFQMDSEGNWWFRTVGKGNKEREVSVSDSMLSALKRYRISRGLPPLPSPGEKTPLIVKKNNIDPVTTTRQIRAIVQNCFDTAIERLIKDSFHEEAEQLKAATVHWLRHTGISDDVKHRPREHVRDDAGHSSSAITDKYIDIDKRERHRSARKKLIHT